MVCEVAAAIASDTSAVSSQLADALRHCTRYPVTGEPPSEPGASQRTSREPVSRGDTRTRRGAPGAVADTASVGSLSNDSSLPASSVKLTLTVMVLPESSSTRV